MFNMCCSSSTKIEHLVSEEIYQNYMIAFDNLIKCVLYTQGMHKTRNGLHTENIANIKIYTC